VDNGTKRGARYSPEVLALVSRDDSGAQRDQFTITGRNAIRIAARDNCTLRSADKLARENGTIHPALAQLVCDRNPESVFINVRAIGWRGAPKRSVSQYFDAHGYLGAIRRVEPVWADVN
jgi:hypothetical protein